MVGPNWTSEDELARRLKRADWQTVFDMLNNMPTDDFRKIFTDAASKAVWFNVHGWTWKEYQDEAQARTDKILGRKI